MKGVELTGLPRRLRRSWLQMSCIRLELWAGAQNLGCWWSIFNFMEQSVSEAGLLHTA
ncbi:MAG: hypothetical protein CM1200mP36_00210 [Gammaproteobacteria bacterium]|nr:MAG: hypothetical protein CM1200mP36_00210 [Gammaproteobacteria bacterium]